LREVADYTVTTTGQQLTGMSDTVCDLTSVFYHAAQGGQVYAKYIEDAQREGDTELVEFFREVQEQYARRAQKAKALLSTR
jgi:rubrerythrin